ncbi:hypothetical protein AB990_08120 [Alkalihalobacillus pseudalcaliphilus]|nr:hypothetical protein AB990_08120 [Alkalihalobacillus pseudalcaliphilus]
MKKWLIGTVSTAMALTMLTACGGTEEPNDPMLDENVPTEDPVIEDDLNDDLNDDLDGDLDNDGVDTQGMRGKYRRNQVEPYDIRIDRNDMRDYDHN